MVCPVAQAGHCEECGPGLEYGRPRQPKPGDPDFRPRHPVVDLVPIRQRIEERRAAARGHSQRAVLEGDTEIMDTLVREVTNLRIAIHTLKHGDAPFDWRGTYGSDPRETEVTPGVLGDGSSEAT